MELNAVRLVSAEIMSIIICIIIGYGNRFEAKKRTKRGDIYFIMLMTNIVALIFDILCWELEGRIDYKPILYISNLFSICLTLVLLGQFAMYIGAMIIEKKNKKSRLLNSSIHICFFLAAVILILFLFGKIMIYDNGYYVNGQWYIIYIISNIVSMLITTLVLLVNIKTLGKHDTIVSLAYIFIPLLSATIGIFVEGFSYGYVASTISLLELYVFIQSEENSKLEAEGNTNKYYANHDELTGLMTRRAFSERIDELAKLEGTIGVIFCDVNGLKYTNDNFGHNAGDKLLIDFSQKLGNSFPNDEIFRIGGDEFIVFVTDENNDNFTEKVISFEKSLNDGNNDMACIGDEFGNCQKVEELVKISENKMYRKKEEYHKKHPEQRRLFISF